jgi:hypothetical protein
MSASRSITGKTLWARTLLTQELRGLSHDDQLGLELPNPTPRGAQFG